MARVPVPVHYLERLEKALAWLTMIEHHAHGPTSCLGDDQSNDILVRLPAKRRHDPDRLEGVSGRNHVARTIVRKHSGNSVFCLEFRRHSLTCVDHWRSSGQVTPPAE